MKAYGTDLLSDAAERKPHLLKLILNENAVTVFPPADQHRDHKTPGLSYADDSAGNALAATLKDDTLDVRAHRGFPEQRVCQILGEMLRLEEFAFLRGGVFRYGGHCIVPTGSSE